MFKWGTQPHLALVAMGAANPSVFVLSFSPTSKIREIAFHDGNRWNIVAAWSGTIADGHPHTAALAAALGVEMPKGAE